MNFNKHKTQHFGGLFGGRFQIFHSDIRYTFLFKHVCIMLFLNVKSSEKMFSHDLQFPIIDISPSKVIFFQCYILNAEE